MAKAAFKIIITYSDGSTEIIYHVDHDEYNARMFAKDLVMFKCGAESTEPAKIEVQKRVW